MLPSIDQDKEGKLRECARNAKSSAKLKKLPLIVDQFVVASLFTHIKTSMQVNQNI